MPELAYRIVNVFTRAGALTGNPLCVFEDGRALDDATMQALARQFNLSETTFILPSDRATARVRIFTPSYEMPFAGHPTLGTAHVVRSLEGAGDSLTLEMKAGIIPVAATGDCWTLAANAPRSREVGESRGDLADILGLAASDIAERPLWVNAGKEQLIVPVASPRRCAERAPCRRLRAPDKRRRPQHGVRVRGRGRRRRARSSRDSSSRAAPRSSRTRRPDRPAPTSAGGFAPCGRRRTSRAASRRATRSDARRPCSLP